MNSDRVGSALRVAASLLLVVAGLAAPGCKREPDAVQCPTGVYCPAGSRCAASEAVCIWDDCGDGTKQAGEACDDGNKRDKDGCSADCQSNETCGNSIIDKAVGEVCDKGNDIRCAADCKSVQGCGNGLLDEGEDCDGGPSGIPNVALETAGCNSNCKYSRCGDGVVNQTAGEKCDRLGDGVPGANGLSATCNVDCTNSVCGDELKNALASEECDEGLANGPNRTCLSGTLEKNLDCKWNACGDGFTNEDLDSLRRPKEECDLGTDVNSTNTGACLSDCRDAKCGDGHVWAGHEACDAGPESAKLNTVCPYGQQQCTLCSVCQEVTGSGPYCGDGRPTNGETCDAGAGDATHPGNGATACAYGTPNCRICNATCSAEVAWTGPYCGDKIQNGGETCDDGSVDAPCTYGEQSCVRCNPDCKSEYALKGRWCGDFVETDGEVCDAQNSFTCGTCGAPGTEKACTFVDTASATGSLTIVSTNLVGVTFTLDDGKTTKTFEFIAAGGSLKDASNKAVVVGGSVALTAIAVVEAISDPAFGITAVAGADGRVDLTNSGRPGMRGNEAITTTAPDGMTPPTVTGMDGGIGCRKGQRCAYDEDCIAPLVCSGGTCG